jgi:hypothetical protein
MFFATLFLPEQKASIRSGACVLLSTVWISLGIQDGRDCRFQDRGAEMPSAQYILPRFLITV